MTKAEERVDGQWLTRGEYARDALMRRIEKAAGATMVRFWHDGWQVIEETEGAETPSVERQFVFGNGIDEAPGCAGGRRRSASTGRRMPMEMRQDPTFECQRTARMGVGP